MGLITKLSNDVRAAVAAKSPSLYTKLAEDVHIAVMRKLAEGTAPKTPAAPKAPAQAPKPVNVANTPIAAPANKVQSATPQLQRPQIQNLPYNGKQQMSQPIAQRITDQGFDPAKMQMRNGQWGNSAPTMLAGTRE